VGIWLRYVGNGLTFVCGLAVFVFWDLLVFVGFGFLVGETDWGSRVSSQAISIFLGGAQFGLT
jgi:hypothetical protein